MATCIDLSTWNGSVNFNSVKYSGVTTVLLRVGFGREVSQKDNRFEEYYKGVKAAGLKIGAYWYSYAESVADAEREAKACLSILNGRSLDYPVYFDMEESWQTTYGKATLTAMAERFCEIIRAGGYSAGVYANANWFSNYLNYSYLSSKYSIWLAQWAGSYSFYCDIWQYSESGSVSGISGNVDLNAIIKEPSKSAAPSGSITATATVSDVQRWLNKVYNAKLEVDGIYGALTKKAIVKGLQNVLNVKYGAKLVVDGIFGPATKKAVVPLKKGARGGYPSILQAFLICEGYDTGGFDGDFGNRTESAVKSFQTVNGLSVTGIADRNTFEKLAA